MRLFDQVSQSRMPIEIADEAGVRQMPGCAERSAEIANCPIRFVLDANASQRCLTLLSTDGAMLTSANEMLRAPATDFWIEWIDDVAGAKAHRTGLLVRADISGRSGTIETFWEQECAEPVRAQADLLFDLDNEIAQYAGMQEYVLGPTDHSLSRHLIIQPDSGWLPHFQRCGSAEATKALSRIAVSVLSGLDFLFAFAALFSERTTFSSREIDLERLNRKRIVRYKAPLLDYVEVSFDLNKDRAAERTLPGYARHEAPRLHYVRGHMVRRAGQHFWRRSHLRGDAAKIVCTRTVRVTSTAK